MESISSNVKSVISVDEEVCDRQSCFQLRKNSHLATHERTSLTLELERCHRRISLLEKNKEITAQEMDLNREELASKTAKIRELQGNLKRSVTQLDDTDRKERADHLQIIVSEQEEQIQMMAIRLQSSNKDIEELEAERELLLADLESKLHMFERLKSSTDAQINCLLREQEILQEQLTAQKECLRQRAFNNQAHLERNTQKWSRINTALTTQLTLLQEQLDNANIKQNRIQEELEIAREEREAAIEQVEVEKERVSWLETLLEEAKCEFINVELRRQEEREKMIHQKKELQSRNRTLKEQLKSGKTEATTVPPSAKTYRRHGHTATVTPFRLTPDRRESQLM